MASLSSTGTPGCVLSAQRNRPRPTPLSGYTSHVSDDCSAPGTSSGAICCKQIAEFSVDFLDGTLAPADRARFEAHLSRCPECVRYFETYRRTPGITRECFVVGMPDRVRESIRSFLRDRCRE